MGRFSSSIAAVLGGNMLLILLAVTLQSDAGVAATIGSISSIDHGSSSCNFTTLFSMRSTWSGVGEPCNQKLPFEFWIYMKAEGSAGNPDADHVRNECLLLSSIDMVELITPEDWNTTTMDAAPGQLLRETKRAACYLVQSPLDFEAMCSDAQVTKVSRINAVTAKTRGSPPKMPKRRLQDTLSVARIAHGVDVLISGLEELGCQRTTGEDQTLCIMSDSFNRLGNLATLQESGDLPPDEFLTIVEELPEDFNRVPTDEGSAMMELAYDIASGANFKFNTFIIGSMEAADDIITLASDEACDIMVDDIGFFDQPGFRDGIIAEAVDEVVADGILYFSSTGNSGNGFKFTSNWECASELFEDMTLEPCDSGVASHVFNPDTTGIDRYRLSLSGEPFIGDDTFILHWDDDEGTQRGVTVELWTFEVSGTEEILFNRTEFLSDFGTAVVDFGSPDNMPAEYGYFITISQEFTDLEGVEMRLLSRPAEIFSDFSDGSVYGHKCAASTISVAAINIAAASGVDGRFTDPEPSSVELFSSRGPCYINSGGGLEERLKPVTTAANQLATSTVGFESFPGTSAAAPVAAAIATIVRAACYPREVTFTDMMEMLTDYTYTIDVTSDADGEEETWGVEAGYGIISADQMLGWIAANCQESCPGASTPSPSVPTPAPSTTPTTEPPTIPPVSPPTVPPTSPPSVPPTTPPVAPPTSPSTTPSITPPTMPPVAPTTAPPIVPPTTPPVAPPTAPPIIPPTTPPVAPPTAPPIVPPTTPPVAPPTAPPIVPPTTPPVAPPTAPPIVPPTTPPVAPPTAPPIVPPTTPPAVRPTAPPIVPPTTPPVAPPTAPPIVPPTTPPVAPPTAPPIVPPTTPPVAPPTAPPIVPPTNPPVAPPTAPPIVPPTNPPVAPPNAPPIVPPTTPPVAPPTAPPIVPPTTPPITMPPIAPPISPPAMPTTQSPVGGLVDASERTLVTVTANAYDSRTTGFGCPPNGCVAANTRDGDLSTRWSCKEDLLGGTNCEITYTFEEPQDIVRVRIAFYKGDERTRVLKIKLNGSSFSVIESSGETDGFEEFELDTDDAEMLTFEGIELRGQEWISISEVQLLVL